MCHQRHGPKDDLNNPNPSVHPRCPVEWIHRQVPTPWFWAQKPCQTMRKNTLKKHQQKGWLRIHLREFTWIPKNDGPWKTYLVSIIGSFWVCEISGCLDAMSDLVDLLLDGMIFMACRFFCADSCIYLPSFTRTFFTPAIIKTKIQNMHRPNHQI